jgi:hypothetical protein
MPPTTTSTSSPWRLEQPIASLDASPCGASIDLAHGAHEVKLHLADGTSSAALWQLRQLAGLPLAEAYVRQADLVASYAPDPSFPFTTDIYWTLLDPAPYPAASLLLQMVVSVRTDKLDTHPELDAVSTSANLEVELVPCLAGSAIRTPLSSEFHLVEFATREDAPEFELVGGGRVQTMARRLFGHFLEKGVIRRARLFAAVVSAETTLAEVQDLCEELAASEWPLTA